MNVFIAIRPLLLVVVLAPIGLVAQQEPPFQSTPAPHADLRALDDDLVRLKQEGSLTAGQAHSMRQSVWRARESLQAGGLEGALDETRFFRDQVAQHERTGQLGLKDAGTLLFQADHVIEGLQFLDLPPNVVELPFSCQVPTGCDYYVIPVLVGSPSSVQQALAFAERNDVPCVQVEIDRGNYNEGALVITRPTRLNGAGRGVTFLTASIQNPLGFPLEISNVTLRESAWPGAVVVNQNGAGPCGSTVLDRVTISGARGYGVLQRGGTLLARDVWVIETEAEPGDANSGAGFYLADGVAACVNHLLLHGNAGGGLRADGTNTRVHMNHFFASENRPNPDALSALGDEFIGGLGTIEARAGALLLAEFGFLYQNDFVGLFVEEGAKAHWRYGTIDRTRRVSPGSGRAEGINALVDDSDLVLTGFRLVRGGLIGLLIIESRPWLEDGVISGNVLGLVIRGPYNQECLINDVYFGGNDTQFEATEPSFARPMPADFGDGSGDDTPPPPPDEDVPRCADVPFAPTWCRHG